MLQWLHAYLLTQVIEVPLYLRAGRRRPDHSSLLAAAGASTLTHPILWFCFPWGPEHYLQSLIAGETFVVLTEAALLYAARYPRPLLTSLAVNAISCATGLALHALGLART